MSAEQSRSIDKISGIDLQTDLFQKYGMEAKLKKLLTTESPTEKEQVFLTEYFPKTTFAQKNGKDVEAANFEVDGVIGDTTKLIVAYFRYEHGLALGMSMENVTDTQAYIVEQEAVFSQVKSQLNIVKQHTNEIFSLNVLKQSPFGPDQITEFTTRAIDPTLEISKVGHNELKPENYVKLEYALQNCLKSPADNGLSGDPKSVTLKDFDNRCTEVRKEILREQLISMSGDEFYEHTQDFTYASRRQILGRVKGKAEPPDPVDFLNEYKNLYAAAAKDCNIPEALLVSIHYGESLFDHLAVSTGDCYGLGQHSKYVWAQERDGVSTGYKNINPLNIRANIKRTAEHLESLYASFAGEHEPRRSELVMIAYSSNGPDVAKKMMRSGQDTGDIQYVRHTRQRRRELENKLQAVGEAERAA